MIGSEPLLSWERLLKARRSFPANGAVQSCGTRDQDESFLEGGADAEHEAGSGGEREVRDDPVAQHLHRVPQHPDRSGWSKVPSS